MGKRPKKEPEVQLQQQTETFPVLSLAEVEAQATELYTAGQQAMLIAVWNTLDEESQLQYFNLAVNVVKSWLASGNYPEAEKVLRVVAKYHEVQNNAYEQARIHLQRANLYFYTHNHDGVHKEIEKVRQLTDALNLLGECKNLEGEMLKGESPEAAMSFYLQAVNYYREYTQEDERGTYDLARTYLFLADAALVQGLVVSGQNYLRQAQAWIKDFQKTDKNPDMVGWAYLKMGSSYEAIGDYDRARFFYEEAETAAPDNKTRLAEVRWHRAYLAMLRGNDVAAQDELSVLDLSNTDNVTARVNGLITKGYIDLYLNQPEKAEQAALEAQLSIIDKQSLLAHRALLLKTAALMMQDRVDEAALDALQLSIEFLEGSHHYIEASQGYLIYAWGCVALDKMQAAQASLVQCIRQCDLVDHVRHLARLYRLSLPTLNGWWQNVPNYHTFLPKMTACLNALPNQASRDHFFLQSLGKAQIMVGNEVVLSVGRGENLALALFFYMVQHRRARSTEITAALWSTEEAMDVGEDTLRRRFNFHNAFLKRKFGFEWMTYDPHTEYYTLKVDRIAYHDAEAFETIYKEAGYAKSETTRLLKYQQAINLYTEGYLRELSFDFVEQQRLSYCRIYGNLLNDAIVLAEKLDRHDLATDWKMRRDKFHAEYDDLG